MNSFIRIIIELKRRRIRPRVPPGFIRFEECSTYDEIEYFLKRKNSDRNAEERNSSKPFQLWKFESIPWSYNLFVVLIKLAKRIKGVGFPN